MNDRIVNPDCRVLIEAVAGPYGFVGRWRVRSVNGPWDKDIELGNNLSRALAAVMKRLATIEEAAESVIYTIVERSPKLGMTHERLAKLSQPFKLIPPKERALLLDTLVTQRVLRRKKTKAGTRYIAS